ncbi:transcriptional regulator, Crp/Fnr family [Arcobacter nitrofigilis DSM 7299]|uniref:Transcriptional regulator, Crp/Fnr family n=1 Tax=Arcobacter nitrofigilis (strain ATCC 33309 / DSM 7299 / CCUG 15893 / LMG 7604 / NCTC 12251 / CI) TaxID=572480 RepID=D5V636_ARCNC|nr:Crp/Fnr family transcriptional regulator [Arcobacter nitrofigilis]ADG93203.1 transcriptional regulator, Crp/Fnr family [Arcobacter nitrofigilis DSM 7299]
MNIHEYYFFDSLDEKEKKELEKISRKKSYKKDEILFYKGDEAKYLYLLVSGIVKVYKHDYKDNEVIIHNLRAPTFIAEIANYEEIPYPANCSFEVDSEVYVIEYNKFKENFLYKPEISMMLIKSLTKKIKALENFINFSITADSNIKIAQFLYENEDILLSLRQVKIASILNITPETLSRKISKLKKDKILENDKGYIKILDHKKLKELSQF